MRVLVATDGSRCAGVAVDMVAAMAWPPGSIIHVIEAIASGPTVFGGPWPPITPIDTVRFDDDIRHRAEENVASARARLSAPSRSVEASVVGGRAAGVILSVAKETDADVVVVGSRGHGMLESMLLGSVSAEVVDGADVPVLVARGTAVKRIVFAWDGSAGAEQAAGALMDWGIFAACRITVVSVAAVARPWWAVIGPVDEEVVITAYEEAAESSRVQHGQLARDMAQQLQEAGLHAAPEQREGDPAEEIVNVVKSSGADLVVVGTHGRSGLRRFLMGSVARNVLHHAPCSVLIAREARAGLERSRGRRFADRPLVRSLRFATRRTGPTGVAVLELAPVSWLQDDHRGLSRPSGGIAVDIVSELLPAGPESRSFLASGRAPAHGAGLILQLDGGLWMRLQVEPPGRLAIGPAVHGHGHQIGAVLVVAEDGDALLARLAAGGLEAHRPPLAGLRRPQALSPAGEPVESAMPDPRGAHEPAGRESRGTSGPRGSGARVDGWSSQAGRRSWACAPCVWPRSANRPYQSSADRLDPHAAGRRDGRLGQGTRVGHVDRSVRTNEEAVGQRTEAAAEATVVDRADHADRAAGLVIPVRVHFDLVAHVAWTLHLMGVGLPHESCQIRTRSRRVCGHLIAE